MQHLIFESAWDRTISPQDRNEIISFFHSTASHIKEGVHFSFLREATNHRGDILVTVLIHNGENKILSIKDTIIRYVYHDQIIATNTFSIPCHIKEKTSMPWTFIFSIYDQTDQQVDYTITV